MSKIKNENGIVTVFLCLIFLVIISLIFTLLESARASGIKERVQLSVNSAVQSVFASYDRPLFDKYGLLFFTDQKGKAEEFSEMVRKYIDKNSADDLPGRDWTGFETKEITVNKYASPTDSEGEIFLGAVLEYMKDCGLYEEALSLVKKYKSSKEDFTDEDFCNNDGEIDIKKIQNKIEDVSEKMEEAESQAENTDTEETSVGFGEALGIYSGLKNNFNNVINNGILKLTCSDYEKLSDKSFEKSDFPSLTDEEIKDRNDYTCEEMPIYDKMICNEYFLSNLDSYAVKDYSALQVEYIIAGKESDADNMASVCKRLLAIRLISNLIFIHTNASYSSQAEAAAIALVGWTGIEALIEPVSEIIMILWAVAESNLDVKTLTGGGRVPLYKNPGEWKLSLEGAASGNQVNSKSNSGLNYTEYLRLLINLNDINKNAYRAMDMIQLDIQKTEKAFLMKNCIYAADVSVKASSNSMFPFLPENFLYEFEASDAFAYGNVVDY